MQLDWTKANELGITIGGHPLDHLLCHGLSVAVFKPGVGQPLPVRVLPEPGPWAASQPRAAGHKKPRHLGTGHSRTATHESSPGSGPRGFNPDDLDLGQHFDLSPVTFNAACPPEHGDVESQNGHRKRSSKQPLLLRGSRDFESEEADDQAGGPRRGRTIGGCRKFLLPLRANPQAADRKERKRDRWLKESGRPAGKTFGTLDEEKRPVKIRRLLPPLLEGGWAERAENLLAFGLVGRGNTHTHGLAALGRTGQRQTPAKGAGVTVKRHRKGHPLTWLPISEEVGDF